MSVGRACLLFLIAASAFGQTPVPDDFNPGADDTVSSLALQPDGMILVGGYFNTLGGQTRNYVGGLKPDGTLDASFNSGASDPVLCLAVQVDGKVLVGGWFNTLGGQFCKSIGRLNADGTLEASFNAGAWGSQFNMYLGSIVLQPDGKILVGGEFTLLGWQSRNGIGRLNADGTLDTSFDPRVGGTHYGSSWSAFSLAMQPDGKILVGGDFGTLGGQSHNGIGRLNADGTLDESFNPETSVTLPFNHPYISSLVLQADGKVLVVGSFDTLGGQTCSGFGRLNPDGTLDTSFNPAISGSVLALQANGKILVAGGNLIRRLNADGTLDTSFNPGPVESPPQFSAYVLSLLLQPDGKVLVGGYFSSLGGLSRANIGRLNNTESATQNLTFDGSTLTWMRGGSSPEVWRTTFDYSPDGGGSWTNLGKGTRITGGWELTGLALPPNASIRARGFTMGGIRSDWFLESIIGSPEMRSQPVSRTNSAGTTASFNVSAVGTEPLAYQWRKDGVDLADGGNLFGARTASLTLSNVLHCDAGEYSVVITNTAGRLTSAVATLTVIDPAIIIQPASQARNLGESVTLSVGAAGTAPLGYQWRQDGLPLVGATQSSLTLTNLRAADAGRYDLVVTNAWGTATSAVALVTVNQAVPDSFNPGADGDVYSLAVQVDGKILVGGYFGTLGEQSRTGIGRLNANGTWDTSFNPTAGVSAPWNSPSVSSLALQADGKILVGGGFTALGGHSLTNIGRLNVDGTVDTNFASGADYMVWSLALQADGKVLVGGNFSTLGGLSRSHIGRLNSDGTIDTSFNPGADGDIRSIALQPDGKILLGGDFTTLGGQSRKYVGRLNADGTLDTGFNPGVEGSHGGLSPSVWSLGVQADGKILVGGWFSAVGGQSRAYIGRLNADGTVDTSFNPGADGPVYTLALQADGKILVGGGFWTLGGQSRTHIGRLNADGKVDTGFNPGAGGGWVMSLALEQDGKILVGGQFSILGDQFRNRIGRLANTEPATRSLSFDGSTLIWARGGASPEVWRTTFDYSVGGTSWTSLGGGLRIPDVPPGQAPGWQLTGLTLPTTASFRARGYAQGGFCSSSSWLVETCSGSPVIDDQPASLTNNAGTTAVFRVHSGGSEPLGYQWRKDGIRLAEDGNVSGVTTASLTLSNVLRGDEGAYSVVITNAAGSVTSAIAILSVIDPAINLQPTSQARNAGEGVTFNVGAAGTAPLRYRWQKDGTGLTESGNVSGVTTASLTLSNVLHGDAGMYSVVITSAAGSVTSAVATLIVIDPAITVQPMSQARNAGEGVTLNVGAAGTAPLSFQWRHEGVPLAGATQPSLTIMNLQAADAGDYDVVITNAWGSVTSARAFVTVNQALPDSLGPGADGDVYSLALQADGKILVGGYFNSLGGQNRHCLGRLNADGTADIGFNCVAAGTVSSFALQADGKILVGGYFNTLGGQSRNCLGRIYADGTVDMSFNPDAWVSSPWNSPYVSSLALQADGKILVGGYFNTLGGQGCNYIGRLDVDGTVDTSFNPMADGGVQCLALQADGRILVGGWFTTLGGQSRNGFGRLNADGTLDTGFNPVADGGVQCLAVQPDGKVLVGGWFTTLGGQSRHGLGRLNADGTVDASFNPEADGVQSLALQTDGKILVGGWFTTLNGQNRNFIGRLNVAGSLDATFNPGADAGVTTLMLQAGGKILVGGYFAMVGGRSSSHIGRINNTEPAIQSLSLAGAALTWTRAGASPEVRRTTFDYSLDGGGSWMSLGGGNRIPVGWQLAGLALPPIASIRARGFTAGGIGSDWFVETFTGSPVIDVHPASLTNNAGTTAVLSVYAAGSGPLGYQWRKDGANLTDGGSVLGATTSTLTLSNVLREDAGSYVVLVTNAVGSMTGAVATLTVIDPAINVQPTSQTRYVGEGVTLSVGAAGTEPLLFQWRLNGGLLVGATQSSLVLTNLQAVDAGYYDVVVTSSYGSLTSAVASLTVYLSAPDSLNPEANGGVNTLAVQADGKILVGGSFTMLGGQSRDGIGRVNANGTVDTSFNPGVSSSSPWNSAYVSALALQTDGKILVGGSFATLGGKSCNNIGRLNADGTVDASFNPWASSAVTSLAVQADGKILVGGYFTTLDGEGRNYIGRLNADGTLDVSFNPGTDSVVWSLALQADGKILVGGWFTTLGGQNLNSIGRLNADGTVDISFNPGAGGTVSSLAWQADGKILVGGSFTMLGGQNRNYIGRLNADGTVDTGFNPMADGDVQSLALQADGRIVVGGWFTTMGGQNRSGIGRLNADGTLDVSFNSKADNAVWSLALQADGKILVGGSFTTLGGQSRDNIGRLNNTDPASQSLTCDGSTVRWMRGGASPEVWRTTFDYSLDGGGSWTGFGWGNRIPGGWQLAGVALPLNASVRARGFTVGGDDANWFVETIIGSLAIGTQPASLTNNAGTIAVFSVYAGGSEPLAYQWRKDGADLADGGNVSGSASACLTVSNVLHGDAGSYSLVITNAAGSTTSAVATLTVIDPAINAPPASQAGNPGDGVALNVGAVGTAPLRYQWRQDGVPLVGATQSWLALTNLQAADAGYYDVVVTNAWGSVTSATAMVSVNLAAPESFDPGADGRVCSLALQSDGKILVGGYFRTLSRESLTNIGRLHADGTVDTGFNPRADGNVNTLALQSDGKILVGGSFTTLGRQSCTNIGRLNRDGTLNTSFSPGADGGVNSLAVQADGRILVGGDFTTLGGQSRTNIGRLNADGTVDASFNPGAGGSASWRGSPYVLSLALQADGKILVGGYFTTLGGQSRNSIGRLNADGSVDTGFNPGVEGPHWWRSASVSSLALQADGKILVGGDFSTMGGQSCVCIGRLNPDGMVDTSFNPGADNAVSSLALQADGKILVGGSFAKLGGQNRSYIGRLNADGTVDTSFNPGVVGSPAPWGWPTTSVSSLALQADGEILVVGEFVALGGQNRTNIGRLNNTEPATQSLTFSNSTLTWTRGGASPEVWRTTFDYSLDGGDSWTRLGEGVRILGAWQHTGFGLPTNASFRALGQVTGGICNASGWFVEAYAGAPVFIHQSASQTNGAGEIATFSVLVGGTEPFSYQWFRNGIALRDGGNVTGTYTSTLTVRSVLASDTGSYSVIVTNAYGSVTRAVAVLTVTPPERFVSITVDSNRRLRTTILGPPGRSFTLQGTTNFTQWADLGRCTNQTGTLVLTNVPPASPNAYFLRTVFLPGR